MLLAFALNRSLQLSDESLIVKMKTNLAADGYRFRALVETIVASPQFLDRRLPEQTASATPEKKPDAAPAAQPDGKMIKINFKKGE